MTEVQTSVQETSVQEVKPPVEPPKDPQAKPAQTVPDFKGTKHKVKIFDKEQEVDYEELVRGYQIRKASDEKFQQASEKAKEYEEFQKDPWKFLQKKGKDPYKVAEELLMEKLQWEQMTPEQKELAEVKRKNVEYEQQVKDLSAAERQRLLKDAEASAVKEVDEEIYNEIQEISKSTGEEITKESLPYFVMVAANTMLAHHEAKNGQRMPTKDAVSLARKHIDQIFTSKLNSLSPEGLAKVLSPKILDGLRKLGVEKALSQDPMRSRKSTEEQTTVRRSAKPIKGTTDDYFKKLDQKWSK